MRGGGGLLFIHRRTVFLFLFLFGWYRPGLTVRFELSCSVFRCFRSVRLDGRFWLWVWGWGETGPASFGILSSKFTYNREIRNGDFVCV